MARRNHPNKKYSGLWRPSDNDKHDLATLKRMRDWFANDLKLAQAYYDKDLKRFVDAGWSASNGSFREMVTRARRDIEISKTNLALVDRLIESNQ